MVLWLLAHAVLRVRASPLHTSASLLSCRQAASVLCAPPGRRYEEYAALGVNMRTFGSSGHVARPSGSTLHNYIKCAPCMPPGRVSVAVPPSRSCIVSSDNSCMQTSDALTAPLSTTQLTGWPPSLAYLSN